ncbi:MAG TPA: peptide ABC transporter substrate-binding protein [Candidatus Limnocylindrales bacterium]|nr:peptide ABC transporter substrate-binding protein [Candidatus Limnocylindrales bacterium]
MRVSGRRSWRAAGIAIGLSVLLMAAGGVLLGGGAAPARAGRTDVTIIANPPTTLDAQSQSDIDSAAIAAQLFESLTTFDANLVLRPALAQSWDVSADGKEVVFHLRPGLVFSDGSALGAGDVVRSWLRIIDPKAPSPLATLMLDVQGARAYLAGTLTDPSQVGLHANGNDLVVDLERPGADFPSVVASPTFAVMPPPGDCESGVTLGQCGVSSGAYTLTAATSTELTLAANPRYWAGAPAIGTIHVMTDTGGRSPVDVFQSGAADLAPIAENDASWIRFDSTLGPDLREIPSLSTNYLGFDTSKAPFNDPQVRLAIGEAVDWQRIVQLASFGGDVPATSLVPPGIPGRGAQSWLPAHDPAGARALLAKAGYPGGAGFPSVALVAGSYGSGIAADLQQQLGITVRLEAYDDYFTRLSTDPPAMWLLGWVADYPGENDFLGVLLGTGSASNYGKWSSPAFDNAISRALATRDATQSQAAFDEALGIVESQVPAIPLAYPGPTWMLAANGLLGAGVNGLGIPRYASLAWAP